jgi:4-hydroxybenzoyl-CoA thioesterase
MANAPSPSASSLEGNAPRSSRTVAYAVRVEFGDCDPAGIVWFPNFFRWIDAASRHYFTQCGVPPWSELEARTGVLGTPLVDTRSRFVNTASYGDMLSVHAEVTEWRGKSFVMHYRITRGEGEAAMLIMTCEEVRIFASRRPPGEGASANGNGIRAVSIPDDIRRLCT